MDMVFRDEGAHRRGCAVGFDAQPGDDAGHQGGNKREESREADVDWRIVIKPGKRRVLDKAGAWEASVRAKVEHSFLGVKRRRLKRGRSVRLLPWGRGETVGSVVEISISRHENTIRVVPGVPHTGRITRIPPANRVVQTFSKAQSAAQLSGSLDREPRPCLGVDQAKP